MQSLQPYHNSYEGAPAHLQDKAKQLCREYNQTAPREEERRRAILQQLFGSCDPQTFIEPSFHCDYAFNIHTHGFALLNYNCVILDTSPVHIGAGVFIAPGVCLACLGHAIDPAQRAEGIGSSAPITIEDRAWIGTNVTVYGGCPLQSTPPHHRSG